MWHRYPYTDMHEINLDWVIGITKNTEEGLEELKEAFESIKIMTREEIIKLVHDSTDDVLKESKSYTDAQIIVMRAVIENELQSFVDEATRETLIDAKAYADGLSINDRLYTDSKIVDYNYMFNPLNGKYMTVQDVMLDVINTFHRANSISASEYDNKNMRAGTYDSKMLTAYNYDYNARTLL